MRKIFSLIAAVLFAGSMMADPIVINASDVTTIASGATSGLDVTLQGINIVWQGAYYNSDGSDGGSASVDFRVYASKSMTLTAESNISKVEIAGYCKAGLTVTANAGTITTGASYASETTKGTLEDPLIVVDEIGATSVTLTCTKQVRAYTLRITLEGEGGGVEPGDEPTVLQAVSDSTTWDFSKITANTTNALYNKEGIQLTDESEPSKNDEVIYADYSEDFMTIGEEFNKAAIAFKGEYPIRKNQYCQAGTLHFKADVAGTIVVKFSDTGSSASATAVKRYLVVNDEQTEYWTSRENNGETPYDAQLNVVSGKIEVPAGDVTITGSSAITMYYVTFVPEEHTGTAINNTAAEIKTIKRIENGQLVIIKNGVKYNAVGTVVR